MKLEEDKRIAREFIGHIKDVCERIEIAGEIRRLCDNPDDIDLVAIPKSYNRIMIAIRLGQMDRKLWELKRYNPEFIELIFKKKQIYVYIAQQENWGAMLLLKTGSAAFYFRLQDKVISKNMFLSESGLFDRYDNQKIAGETEEGIFEELGLAYQLPEERE